jgi:hypothetical protein
MSWGKDPNECRHPTPAALARDGGTALEHGIEDLLHVRNVVLSHGAVVP